MSLQVPSTPIAKLLSRTCSPSWLKILMSGLVLCGGLPVLGGVTTCFLLSLRTASRTVHMRTSSHRTHKRNFLTALGRHESWFKSIMALRYQHAGVSTHKLHLRRNNPCSSCRISACWLDRAGPCAELQADFFPSLLAYSSLEHLTAGYQQ